MQQQDSTHETGVRATRDGANSAIRARQRKAAAALDLALSGQSWDNIALILGFPTARAARVATENALERELKADPDSIDKMRKMEASRYERLLRAVWPKAVDPNEPDQLVAVDKARAIIGDHARLMGLNRPTEVIVHNPTMQEIEQWVANAIAAKNGVPTEEGYDVIAGEVIAGALPAR